MHCSSKRITQRPLIGNYVNRGGVVVTFELVADRVWHLVVLLLVKVISVFG